MAQAAQAEQTNMGPALDLEGRVQVYPAHGIPELNAAGGASYEAGLRGEAAQGLFAIICSRDYLPRIEDVNAMKMVDSEGAIRLRDAGLVHWPEQQSTYYTLVYEKPRAARYWQTLDETHPTMTEDTLAQTFVRPLSNALTDYKMTGSVHGAIRPTNVYWKAGSTTAPQLGECLSAACGVGQSVIFEPIERSMCSELARGPGQHADDCYAFGATVAFVILGRNPFQGMSDEEIVKAKLEKGSFNAFVGAKSLPSSQIELLRGLLADDVALRWSAEDIEQWISGRRLTARSSDAGRKSSRQFKVGGKDFWRVKPLVWAMSQNVQEAARVIEDGSLTKWVIRSLGDEEKAKDITEAVERLKSMGNTPHFQDQLVARVCTALDPAAPIHYRGLSVMPQGVATLLAHTIYTNQNFQVIAEIIGSQLVTFWVNMQREIKVDLVPLAQQMERMQGIIEKTSYGEGIERALYELNPAIPCLSPMFKNECVVSPKVILASLERVAGTGVHLSEPMDRHLAGYLVARERRTVSLFTAMDPSEPVMRRGLALLTFLGEMQYRHGPDRVPRLASWIMPLVEPCISRFLSKPFQEKVRIEAKEAAENGDLAKLLRVIDDTDRVSSDEQDFIQARVMHMKITKEMHRLEKELKDKKLAVMEVGRPVAATLASLLAICFIGLTIVRAVLQSIG